MSQKAAIKLGGLAATIVLLATLLVSPVDGTTLYDQPSWNLTLNANSGNTLTGQNFEEYLCTPDSRGGIPGTPPPKLEYWNRSLNGGAGAWEINLNRIDILRANPQCPTPSYIESELVSVPLSQTILDRLYQQGSYRVMYPGRIASWRGVSIGSSWQLSDTVGGAFLGWQSGEPDVFLPDGTIDYSQYKVQIASFSIASSANPFAQQLLNGAVQQPDGTVIADAPRLNILYIDFKQGIFWQKLLTDKPASFFQSPHDYSIGWVPLNLSNLGSTCFAVTFLIDGHLEGTYVNGSSATINPLALLSYPNPAPTGVDRRINAVRRTVPEATQLYIGVQAGDPGALTAANGDIPTEPITIAVRAMSIRALGHL